MADASALGSQGEEEKKPRAKREPILTTFGNDVTLVTCYFLILREHDYRRRQRRSWRLRLPIFGAYRTSMVAQVNAYWACFIFQALAIGLAYATGNLSGGTLYSAMVAASSTFYIAYRTCVVNADKDCRPKIEIHRIKAKSILSVLEEHSRTGLRKEDKLQTTVLQVLADVRCVIGGDDIAEGVLDYWSRNSAEDACYELA